MTPTFNLLDVPHAYAVTPIYARGLTVALILSCRRRPPVEDPSQTRWSAEEHVPNC